MPIPEVTTKRYYGSSRPAWGGQRGKTEEERRGIAVSVAVNNVFGNLEFSELMDVALNPSKLESLLKLVTTLAEHQVRFSATQSN